MPNLEQGENVVHETAEDPLAVAHFLDAEMVGGGLFPDHCAGLQGLIIGHKGEEIIAPNVSSERLITPGRIKVAAFDFAGNEQWKTDVGDFVSAHGSNSCPVLFEDLIVINGDHDGEAYIVALDRETASNAGALCEKTTPEVMSPPSSARLANALR